MSKLSGKTKSKIRADKRKKRIQKNEFYRKGLRDLIRKYDDPVLNEVCWKVQGKEELDFLKKMKAILSVTKDGIGLSASQIGITKRAFIMCPDLKNREFICVINPEIKELSEEKVQSTEGCLSYPGVLTTVERSKWIKVSFKDENMNEVEKTFDGLKSIIFLHEYDHLLGICLVGDEWRNKNK